MCKTGIYNFKSKTFDASNKLWLEGARGSQNWQHGGWACAYWNPRLIKYIGWAVTDDPMDLTNYVPSAEALADKTIRMEEIKPYMKWHITRQNGMLFGMISIIGLRMGSIPKYR